VTEYRFSRRAKACGGCERIFEGGESIFSAIFRGTEGFERSDLCETCFKGSEGSFSHWRSRHPTPPSEVQKLDFNLAKDFLEKLIREADAADEGLAYTLALLLSRKRRVKIKESRRLPDGETLTVVIPRADEDAEVEIPAPRLTDEDVDRLQSRIAQLFGFAAEPASS
jgi:hypothetical protein